MKNFDLDQLERKNIYKTPDNLFADVQKTVLSRTVHQLNPVQDKEEKKGAIVPLKWWYASAAAVALIFGAVFFVDSNDTAEPLSVALENTRVVQDSQKFADVSQPQSSINESSQPEILAVVESTTEKIEQKKEQVNVVEKSVAVNTIKKAKPVSVQQEMELFLESIPQQELAAITAHDQSDIYLDLYY